MAAQQIGHRAREAWLRALSADEADRALTLAICPGYPLDSCDAEMFMDTLHRRGYGSMLQREPRGWYAAVHRKGTSEGSYYRSRGDAGATVARAMLRLLKVGPPAPEEAPAP